MLENCSFFLLVVVGLLIKIPSAPFHHWLLVAHVEASTSGSILLAGVLLKLPACALVRIFFSTIDSIPFVLQGVLFSLSILSIGICVLRLWKELDLKRIIALCSIVHMNVIVAFLGFVSSNSLQILVPSVLTMLFAHSFSSGALFAFAGMISARYHTRLVDQIKGLYRFLPRLCYHFLLTSILAGGLPVGLAFTSELVLFSNTSAGSEVFLSLFFILALFVVFIKVLSIFVAISTGEAEVGVIGVDLTRTEFVLSILFNLILLFFFVFAVP